MPVLIRNLLSIYWCILTVSSLKDEEYETPYGDEPLDEDGAQQEEGAGEDTEEVEGNQQNEDTAEGNRVYDMEEVFWSQLLLDSLFLFQCWNGMNKWCYNFTWYNQAWGLALLARNA